MNASTPPHGDNPKNDESKLLEWIEKIGQESLKARFASAEIVAKETQNTLTVLLAGVGAAASQGIKIFEVGGGASPVTVASAIVCVYLVAVTLALVIFGMRFRSYPAQFQDPLNLWLPEHALDDVRLAEIKNMHARIVEATELNADRAALLNWIRIAAAAGVFVFAAAGGWAAIYGPFGSKAEKSKTEVSCSLDSAASAVGISVRCAIAPP